MSLAKKDKNYYKIQHKKFKILQQGYKMKKNIIVLAFFVLLFCACSKDATQDLKYEIKGLSKEGDFILSKLQKPAIVYFGYTFCPDVCPTTLFMVNNAMDELKIDAQIVFISVDLERDKLENCDIFAKDFRKDAICVRLEQDELDKVAANYGVKYKIERKDGEISVAHSPYVYLIKDGKLVSEISNLAQKALKRELLKIKAN